MNNNAVSPPVPVPEHRRAGLLRIIDAIRKADSIALTTHVNADGDVSGCEAGFSAWLSRAGYRIVIEIPTPFAALYRHVIEDP
jgi:nanoRNase/pAp phosphatase (c-di-AMP/oligoRNAs hydrolase)